MDRTDRIQCNKSIDLVSIWLWLISKILLFPGATFSPRFQLSHGPPASFPSDTSQNLDECRWFQLSAGGFTWMQVVAGECRWIQLSYITSLYLALKGKHHFLQRHMAISFLTVGGFWKAVHWVNHFWSKSQDSNWQKPHHHFDVQSLQYQLKWRDNRPCRLPLIPNLYVFYIYFFMSFCMSFRNWNNQNLILEGLA